MVPYQLRLRYRAYPPTALPYLHSSIFFQYSPCLTLPKEIRYNFVSTQSTRIYRLIALSLSKTFSYRTSTILVTLPFNAYLYIPSYLFLALMQVSSSRASLSCDLLPRRYPFSLSPLLIQLYSSYGAMFSMDTKSYSYLLSCRLSFLK